MIIPLTKGYSMEIDDEDWPLFQPHQWHANLGKATHFDGRPMVHGATLIDGKLVLASRFLMGDPPGKKVDHKDWNTLNNRRNNLRVCDHSQSNFNCRKKKNTKCTYKGVGAKGKKYYAQIQAYNKHYHLGYFSSEVDAAKAYDEAAKTLHGEFAALNFPSGGGRA